MMTRSEVAMLSELSAKVYNRADRRAESTFIGTLIVVTYKKLD